MPWEGAPPKPGMSRSRDEEILIMCGSMAPEGLEEKLKLEAVFRVFALGSEAGEESGRIWGSRRLNGAFVPSPAA